MFVDRFQLVGQGVDMRDRETEVGIVFVSDAERVGLKPESEHVAVPIE